MITYYSMTFFIFNRNLAIFLNTPTAALESAGGHKDRCGIKRRYTPNQYRGVNGGGGITDKYRWNEVFITPHADLSPFNEEAVRFLSQ